MLDPKKIEKFARYLHESVPKVIHNFTCDLDMRIRKILQKQISYMNFINRDEFDMQTQVLFKTQEKLKQLENRLKIIESINKLQNTDDIQP